MFWLLVFLNLLGLNFSLWAAVGAARFILRKAETALGRPGFPDFIPSYRKRARIEPRDVAAVIPAHNESLTIGKTVEALKRIMPASNIYVGSDASTDGTSDIVRRLNCHAVDIHPNRGKAGVLAYLIKNLELFRHYRAVMIVDADTEVDGNYLSRALPLFDDPSVAAVAVHAMSRWLPHRRPRWSMLFTAYRVRLYRVIQAVMRYGQTWKYANAAMIVPGFASIYRTDVLPYIRIDAPNLVIEDYNMTFELHRRKLGRVAYSPDVCGRSQDPTSLGDYYKQVKRWDLGFWQTVRRHGFWPSLFCLSVSVYIFEMALHSLFFLSLPAVFLLFAANAFGPLSLPAAFRIFGAAEINFAEFALSVFLVDYLVTAAAAAYEKKPILLLYGPAFFILRYLDAFVFVYSFFLALKVKSDGRWISPRRSPAMAGEARA